MNDESINDCCRLCGGTLRPHLEVRNYALFGCENCEFVQVSPTPSADDLRSFYGKSYFEKGKYLNDYAGKREQNRRLRLLTRAGVESGARVLDFGCATGEFIAAAGPVYEMWGADISADALARIAVDNPAMSERLLQTTPDGKLPGDDGDRRFDAIVAWDVIEHLTDPAAALECLIDRLAPGGVILLSTPDIGAFVARAMGARWAFMTPPEHLAFFNHRSLSCVLEARKLRVERLQSSGKWANLGFIFYKLGRVFPTLPKALIRAASAERISRLCLYVPTGDILYAVARKIPVKYAG